MPGEYHDALVCASALCRHIGICSRAVARPLHMGESKGLVSLDPDARPVNREFRGNVCQQRDWIFVPGTALPCRRRRHGKQNRFLRQLDGTRGPRLQNNHDLEWSCSC